MNQAQLDILVCPLCKGRLDWDAAKQELICSADKLAFPVKDGIPYMPVTEARQVTSAEA